MPFNSGTGITDHIDLLDKLVEVVTSRYLESVTVNAGGTGHAVGDIIDITATGATSTEVAKLEVTSVAAGVIDGIRVYRAGAYTVDPTTTTGNAQSATTGSGTSATFDLTFTAAKWQVNRRTQEAASATIAAGGSGYTVGDLLTLQGGVQGDVNDGSSAETAIAYVTSVSAGAVTGVDFTSTGARVGNYEEVPANPVATTGGGTGCTLTVTWRDATFAENTGQVCMLQGEGSAGNDAIHVAIKTYEKTIGFNTAYNWALLGTNSYNSGVPLHQQAGINAAALDTADGSLPTGDVGSYMVLKPNDADPDMEWWISHTGRRITLVVKVQGPSNVQYSSAYLGFLNQMATDEEYAYPLAVISGTTDKDRLWTDTTNLSGGILEAISFNNGDPNGPIQVKQPGGSWILLAAEGSPNGSTRLVEGEYGVTPFFNTTTSPGSNRALTDDAGAMGFSQGTHFIIPPTGVPGTPTAQLKPTPGTGSDYYWLHAPICYQRDGSDITSWQLYGEIDGIFWFTNGGNSVVSEDRFLQGTKRYTIFQNGNRTQNWSYFALDED